MNEDIIRGESTNPRTVEYADLELEEMNVSLAYERDMMSAFLDELSGENDRGSNLEEKTIISQRPQHIWLNSFRQILQQRRYMREGERQYIGDLKRIYGEPIEDDGSYSDNSPIDIIRFPTSTSISTGAIQYYGSVIQRLGKVFWVMCQHLLGDC